MQSDLKALEFAGIQRLLEKLASTPYGGEAARNLEPAPDIAVARRMQAAVSAARRLVETGDPPKLDRLPDIRAALRQASQTGAVLAGSALNHIRLTLDAGAALRPFVEREPGLYPGDADHLSPPPALLSLLKSTLQANGHLRPDASETLSALHAQGRALREEVTAVLKARTRAPDLARLLDANSLVWHGNRGMLAVPASHADSIKGVRRGSGPSGRDLVVEPLEAVALNNRLETIGGQQEQEQQAVRRAVTDAVRAEGARLQQLLDALTWIDLAFAGGHLSAHLNAHEPTLVEERVVRLDRAYHPAMLLQFAQGQGPQPVPLTLHLDREQPMLLITGPNTGGKTVVLKTVGLLVTMAHCGLHVPAEGACVIGGFRRVIVDIGDAQSLYHHLSTFAGHVEVLKRVLGEADGDALVLLDELGTGTDPEEGAALAMAVLDELERRQVRGVVTTHLSPLKAYAQTRSGLRNASMHFDREALRPTFRLEVGSAGRSLGLLIAGKNGLPAELVERARAHLARIHHAGNDKEPG